MDLRLIRSCAEALLAWLDGPLDLAFPIAVGLLCLDQRTPAFLTLLVWLIFRLAQQAGRQPLAGVFLLLLGAQAGQFVLERDLQPSSASDPLVIALGCVAMLGRSPQQWVRTLRWIALSIVPLAIWAAGQDPALPLDPPVGGINRLGFLLGLLQLAAWASIWCSRTWWARLFFGGLVMAAIHLALHNGSRVALFAPLLAFTLSMGLMLLLLRPGTGLSQLWIVLLRWRRSLLALLLTVCLCAGGVVIQRWYFSPSSAGEMNALSDLGRVETASCWARQPLKRGGEKLLLGLGYNQAVQARCTAKQVPSLRQMQRPVGLPHAHHLFAQVFAENGLLGLVSLVAVLSLLAWRLWFGLRLELRLGVCGLAFLYSLPLLLYLLMNGLVSSFQIFLMSNQLLIGVALASLWPASERRPS